MTQSLWQKFIEKLKSGEIRFLLRFFAESIDNIKNK